MLFEYVFALEFRQYFRNPRSKCFHSGKYIFFHVCNSRIALDSQSGRKQENRFLKTLVHFTW